MSDTDSKQDSPLTRKEKTRASDKTSKNRQTILVIIALSLSTLALWDTPPQDLLAAPKSGNNVRQPPDSFMTTMSINRFNPDGSKLQHLASVRLEQFKDQQVAKLQQPEFSIYQNNQIQWQGRSDHGDIKNNGDDITLRSNVSLWQAGAKKISLSTNQLNIKPKQKLASSKETVIIKSAGHYTQALGLRADFNSNKFELLNKVQSTHNAR